MIFPYYNHSGKNAEYNILTVLVGFNRENRKRYKNLKLAIDDKFKLKLKSESSLSIELSSNLLKINRYLQSRKQFM